jgi:hypothetical protein
LLLRRWSKAKTGEGQVVLLSGEAGIGKSRETAALLERLSGEPHAGLHCWHGWFTEGFDTRDLKEAKALLEELARS